MVRMVRDVPMVPHGPTALDVQEKDVPVLEARGWKIEGKKEEKPVKKVEEVKEEKKEEVEEPEVQAEEEVDLDAYKPKKKGK